MHDPGPAPIIHDGGRYYVAICYYTWPKGGAEHHHCNEPREHKSGHRCGACPAWASRIEGPIYTEGPAYNGRKL